MKGAGQRTDAKTKAPVPKNFPNIFDFQFYPKRLLELLDKEIYYFRKSIGEKFSRQCSLFSFNFLKIKTTFINSISLYL